MIKTITIGIIVLAIVSLPWIGFILWDVLPYDFRFNSRIIRLIITVVVGIFVGFLFVKQHLGLRVLPIILLLFIGANILWSIQKFNRNKADLISNAIEYPQSLPECEKESNYADLWDYMANGCHYPVEEFIGTLLNRVLGLTLAILLSRITFNYLKTNRSNRKNNRQIRKDNSLIDQLK